jgi:hypothetical protein
LGLINKKRPREQAQNILEQERRKNIEIDHIVNQVVTIEKMIKLEKFTLTE